MGFNPLIQVNDFFYALAGMEYNTDNARFNPLIQVNDFFYLHIQLHSMQKMEF